MWIADDTIFAICYKQIDIAFEIVNFRIVNFEMANSSNSNGLYISTHIRFVRVCSNAVNFNNRNKCLTAKLLPNAIAIINYVKLF